jgi:hypothetical protein
VSWRIGLPVAISIALAGCGGTESESAQVRSVVRQYYAALESGDGAKVCSLVTDEAREHIARPYRLFRVPPQHNIDCARLVTAFAKAQAHDATALRELRRTKIGAVTLIGNRATVIVTEPGTGPLQAPLVKTANGWRVSEWFFHEATPRKLIGGESGDAATQRFLLADDFGARKTIMAGVYVKELHFSEDVKCSLIVVQGAAPAGGGQRGSIVGERI